MRFWEGRSDVEIIWMISGVLLPTLFLMASFMTLRAIVQNRIRRRQLLRAGVVIGMMEDEQRSRRRRRVRIPGMPRFRMPTKEQVVTLLRRDRRRPVNLAGDRRAALRMMESMEAARVTSAGDVLAQAMAATPGVAEGMEVAGAPVVIDRPTSNTSTESASTESVSVESVPADVVPSDVVPVVAAAAAAAEADPDVAPEEESDEEATKKWQERMKTFDGRAPSDAAARVVNRGAAKDGGLAARVTARQKKQRKRPGRGKGLV